MITAIQIIHINMKKYYFVFLLLFILTSCNNEKINWHTSNLEDALIVAQNKIIMIEITDTW